jgi:hypothetical protein
VEDACRTSAGTPPAPDTLFAVHLAREEYMKFVRPWLGVLGSVAILASCSTDRSPFASSPTGPAALTPSITTQGTLRSCLTPEAVQALLAVLTVPRVRAAAIIDFLTAIAAYKRGDITTAQAIAARLYQTILTQYKTGGFPHAGTPIGAQNIVALGKAIFCSVGLSVNLSTNIDDNVVAVVPAHTDTIIKTGTANAGVRLLAAQGLPQTVVVITRLSDSAKSAGCPQYSGPLCTPLAQFPPFYDYTLTPAPALGQSAPPFTVEECVDTTQVHVPTGQLYIAHNITSDSAAVVPKAGGTTLGLACDQQTGMVPTKELFRLARAGNVAGFAATLGSTLVDLVVPKAYALFTGTGITGQVHSFSPFGIVDVNDFVAYQNGGWTYHAPVFTGVPSGPSVGDIQGFQATNFAIDNTWVLNTSAFGNSPFGSGDQGFGCALSQLPYLAKVWPSFSAPASTGNVDADPSTIFLLRKSFFVPSSWSQDLQVGIAVDNDVEVFVNGTAVTPTFVAHEGCAAQDAQGFVFTVPQSMLNLGGQNVLAIRARDRGGESYIDARLSPTTPLTPPAPPAP